MRHNLSLLQLDAFGTPVLMVHFGKETDAPTLLSSLRIRQRQPQIPAVRPIRLSDASSRACKESVKAAQGSENL